MRKITWIILMYLTVSVTGGAAFAKGEKVDVCHRPPGNPDNTKIISVSVNALSAHLAHGDHLSFDNFCYVVKAGDQNATDSEQACQDQFGGHLASIHSQAEDDFISQLVDPNAVGNITARIGGVATNGFCAAPPAFWTDGTVWDFDNWRTTTGEPNCTGAPASVQFWPNTNGSLSGWNDTPSGDALGNFVCKY